MWVYVCFVYGVVVYVCMYVCMSHLKVFLIFFICTRVVIFYVYLNDAQGWREVRTAMKYRELRLLRLASRLSTRMCGSYFCTWRQNVEENQELAKK